MDGKPNPVSRRLRFSLRSLFAAVVVTSLVASIFYQQLQIHRLTQELSQARTSGPIMLFHVPGRSMDPRIAGIVGGQFIESSETLDLRTRRSHLNITADAFGLVADVNGRSLRCKTLNFDQASGRLKLDEARFFERIGVDY
jgi:hypothetical protein